MFGFVLYESEYQGKQKDVLLSIPKVDLPIYAYVPKVEALISTFCGIPGT